MLSTALQWFRHTSAQHASRRESPISERSHRSLCLSGPYDQNTIFPLYKTAQGGALSRTGGRTEPGGAATKMDAS